MPITTAKDFEAYREIQPEEECVSYFPLHRLWSPDLFNIDELVDINGKFVEAKRTYEQMLDERESAWARQGQQQPPAGYGQQLPAQGYYHQQHQAPQAAYGPPTGQQHPQQNPQIQQQQYCM